MEFIEPARHLDPAARRRRSGFTLAEAMLATAVLAIVAASASLPFAAGVQQTNEAAKLEQASALGQAMMEEIMARSFFEPNEPVAAPGPGAGEESRPLFNNIDDFDGYVEASQTLRNFQATASTDPSLAGFWRQVSVQYVAMPSLNQDATDQNTFVHIQVNVYYQDTLLVTLDRIASREY